MDGPQKVAAATTEILDGAVHREKPLRVGRRCEPAHLTLPLPGRLVRDFGKEILDISEAQAKAVVEPDGVTDDFRRESVSAVTGRRACHRPTLSPAAST